MSLEDVRALVTVPDKELVPPPELFWHQSLLHGQAHVARVLLHAFRLVEATGFSYEMRRLWAAVYLHDIARHDDGRRPRHGADAWARLADLPDVRALFARGGVRDEDYPAIQVAVTRHSAGGFDEDEIRTDSTTWSGSNQASRERPRARCGVDPRRRSTTAPQAAPPKEGFPGRVPLVVLEAGSDCAGGAQ